MALRNFLSRRSARRVSAPTRDPVQEPEARRLVVETPPVRAPLLPAPETPPPPEPSAAEPPPAPEPSPVPRTRHGSQSRKRTKGIYVACTPDEYAALMAKAAQAGVSAGGYARACALGAPTPRTRRQAQPDRALFAEAVTALNRTGNNLNQIARALNRDGFALPDDLTTALRDYARALSLLMHAAEAANDH